LGDLLATTLDAFAVFFLAFGLARVFIRPGIERLRIVELRNATARSVFAILAAALLAVTVLRVLNASTSILFAPLEVSVVLSALTALVGLVATVMILFVISDGRDDEDDRDGTRPEQNGLLSWRTVQMVIWLAAIIIAVGLVFGYVALAEFITHQLIVGLLAIGVFWLAMHWIDEIKRSVLEPPRTHRGRLYRLSARAASSRQLTTLSFGLLRLGVFLIAVMAFLVPGGVRTQDWLVLIKQAYFGFEVGDLTISISSIVLALVLFTVGVVMTRAIQHWVSTQFLPTTRLDTGLRNSITTIAGYVGIVLAAVLGIGAAGLDLSSLAIVAGALTVGVGFGLQSIVTNSVPGLILLAARPIKAGDWVVTGGGEGMVRRISVRSTEIETFDQATVIVPNSTLITETLTNWTHRSKLGRVIVTVGVSYSADPEQVSEILLKCAQEHPLILSHPEPKVFFLDFGSDALVFDVRAWVGDILEGFGTKSDLRFAILKALREAGIEIPFPQRDLHIRSGLEALQAPDAPAGTGDERRAGTRDEPPARHRPAGGGDA
ncbi:MAG: mechanosensitive ion channel domain-containing protein, partial [Pseudomonadota bacterium]|nr:mechanosensitive ion channel domain-containing protein [Pseudomonadota bacterium]